MGKEVSGFAYWPDYVEFVDCASVSLFDRNDLVVRFVHRRADEVIHSRIHDQEALASIALVVENSSEQGAGGSDDGASWFEQQMDVQRLEGCRDCVGIVFDAVGKVELRDWMIGDPEPA